MVTIMSILIFIGIMVAMSKCRYRLL